MIPVEPSVPGPLRPEWRLVTYAEHQPEYLPLPTLRNHDGCVISEWEPDEQELYALYGACLRAVLGLAPAPRVQLMLHTFRKPLPPIRLQVRPFTEPFLQTSAPEEQFHAHLDTCAQCRNSPLRPCPTGAKLLEDVALATGARVRRETVAAVREAEAFGKAVHPPGVSSAQLQDLSKAGEGLGGAEPGITPLDNA